MPGLSFYHLAGTIRPGIEYENDDVHYEDHCDDNYGYNTHHDYNNSQCDEQRPHNSNSRAQHNYTAGHRRPEHARLLNQQPAVDNKQQDNETVSSFLGYIKQLDMKITQMQTLQHQQQQWLGRLHSLGWGQQMKVCPPQQQMNNPQLFTLV